MRLLHEKNRFLISMPTQRSQLLEAFNQWQISVCVWLMWFPMCKQANWFIKMEPQRTFSGTSERAVQYIIYFAFVPIFHLRSEILRTVILNINTMHNASPTVSMGFIIIREHSYHIIKCIYLHLPLRLFYYYLYTQEGFTLRWIEALLIRV